MSNESTNDKVKAKLFTKNDRKNIQFLD